MDENRFWVYELADAAGLTRRGIRFFVQQRLLPVPRGVGRGKHYDASHLERLHRIRELQSAGHSLEEIRRILEGQAPSRSAATASPQSAGRGAGPAPVAAPLRAELWRH